MTAVIFCEMVHAMITPAARSVTRRPTFPSGNRMRTGAGLGTIAGWALAMFAMPDLMVGGYEAGFTVTLFGAWLGMSLAIGLGA